VQLRVFQTGWQAWRESESECSGMVRGARPAGGTKCKCKGSGRVPWIAALPPSFCDTTDSIPPLITWRKFGDEHEPFHNELTVTPLASDCNACLGIRQPGLFSENFSISSEF
jgi:hypothetical protein